MHDIVMLESNYLQKRVAFNKIEKIIICEKLAYIVLLKFYARL